LLTSLLIHLFGWPYYLTLAFFAIPLVTLRLKAHDVLLYGIAASFIVGYIGLYYHGIAFGPRYLLGSLPAYILLTARGIVEATSLIGLLLRRIVVPARARVGGIISVGSTLAALISCNLFFYLPHQFPLYYDYLAPHVTGGLAYDRIHPSWMHQAIVFSNDGDLYGNVLFPLNDPQLQGDILYARVIETHNIHSLLVSYPHRALYWAEIFQQELRFSPMNILSASLHQISPVLDKSVPLAGPGFSDLAMDRHGDFFLANSNDGTILHFDPAGRQLGVITTGLPPGSLFRITVFHDSVCWVDSEAGMLWCADIAGQHRHRMLQKPCSACADFTQGPQGDLIAAATSNGMLLRFTSQGVLIATTHAQAGLKQPTSVATTADGRIFTYDVERRQTIEFDRLLQHPKILPFGSDANGSITRLSAFGNWVVALDPATQALVAYNAQTGVIHTVSVSSTGDILPVQGYGLFWNGRQLAFASGFPGVIDVLTTGTVPF